MKLSAILWLIAAFALALSPVLQRSDAKAAVHHASSVPAKSDCHDHTPPPPPEPCSDMGTAKHAAGECCPMMVGAVALLPGISAAPALPTEHEPPVVAARHLTGFFPTKDPPPPRA